jgi:ATP-dependent DNA ligase
MLFAFDLLQLDGRDLRDAPFEARKAMLAKLLRRAAGHLQINPSCGRPAGSHARLAQDEESDMRGGAARSRRGLGAMA